MSSDLQFNNAESLMMKGNLHSLQEGIKTAEYKYGTIQDKEAFLKSLVFMGPPPHWHYCHTAKPATKEGDIYNCITGYYPNREFATIGDVAKAVKTNYSGGTECSSNDILYTLAKQSDWFKRFFTLNAYFDRRLFEPLWVRNWGTETELYLEDGNARALTYALRLLCEEESFCPVKIIWCRSWSHVLSWAERNEKPEYAELPKIDGVEWQSNLESEVKDFGSSLNSFKTRKNFYLFVEAVKKIKNDPTILTSGRIAATLISVGLKDNQHDRYTLDDMLKAVGLKE